MWADFYLRRERTLSRKFGYPPRKHSPQRTTSGKFRADRIWVVVSRRYAGRTDKEKRDIEWYIRKECLNEGRWGIVNARHLGAALTNLRRENPYKHCVYCGEVERNWTPRELWRASKVRIYRDFWLKRLVEEKDIDLMHDFCTEFCCNKFYEELKREDVWLKKSRARISELSQHLRQPNQNAASRAV